MLKTTFTTIEEEFRHHQDNMAAGDWNRCLRAHGFATLEDVLQRATNAQTEALLRDLRPTE